MTARPPNIVVIVTDDQRYDSLLAMPHVRAMMRHGVRFANAFVSNSLCCPSRAAILTGSYSHTNHVYTNFSDPYGGYRAFLRFGDERGTIALALHRAGYRTALIGKYLNAYPGNHVPPGWDRWAAFAREGDGGAYYDYDLFVHDAKGNRFEHHGTAASDYSTTVLKERALAFIRGTPTEHPFFLYLTPFAAHARIVPAPEDLHAYDGYRTPLPPNFDEGDVSDKPSYIRTARPVSASFYEERYRKEYEALRSVDRMVGDILGELRSSGRLHDTLVLFMSDNGAAYGEHRWDFKLTPYEEVIRIPFVIRYPPLTSSTAGTTSHAIVANIDVAPTLADVAGIDFRGVGTVDGTSLVPILDGSRRRVRRPFLLEHAYENDRHPVPAYCALRTPRWMYARYRDGFQELYDIHRDPYELRNLAHVPALAGVVRTFRARTRRICDPPPPGYRWP